MIEKNDMMGPVPKKSQIDGIEGEVEDEDILANGNLRKGIPVVVGDERQGKSSGITFPGGPGGPESIGAVTVVENRDGCWLFSFGIDGGGTHIVLFSLPFPTSDRMKGSGRALDRSFEQAP
jgi:hypothetical protein